jgi:hypothetical protein
MTLIYTTPTGKSPLGLTVPPEALRGVKFDHHWFLYVSDPDVMAVSKFRLTEEIVKEATTSILVVESFTKSPLTGRDPNKKLTAEYGDDMTEWLLTQKFIKVELVKFDGPPSLFGKFPTSGPRPDLDLH